MTFPAHFARLAVTITLTLAGLSISVAQDNLASGTGADQLEFLRDHLQAAGIAEPDLQAWDKLSVRGGAAFLGQSAVYFVVSDERVEEVEFDRLFNRVRVVHQMEVHQLEVHSSASAVVTAGSLVELKQNNRRWTLKVPTASSDNYPLVLAVQLSGQPKCGPELPVRRETDGQFVLDACQAMTHGEKLQFEPLPHKNTVGYWVNADDWAEWRLAIDQPGRFRVENVAGLRHGSGRQRG